MPGPSRNVNKPHSREHRRPLTPGTRAPLVVLPADGCQLPVPAMPAGRTWSEAERQRWDDLWTSPQACAWDETATGTVAALVVYETSILTGTASAWTAAEHRHASEALGLTPKAMAALGWQIETPA